MTNIKDKIMSIFNSEPSGSELTTVWLEKRRQNYDFEVISKVYLDSDGKEYLDEEDFLDQMVHRQIMLKQDVSAINLYGEEDTLEGSGPVFRIGNDVDMLLAKQCGFGVVRMMTDDLRDQKFMFPVKKFDVGVELFAYQVLSTGNYNKKVWHEMNTPEGLKYLRIVLGEEIYTAVLDKIGENEHA